MAISYYVRKSWDDTESQKGAFSILANAKKCADSNPGYFVFNTNGIAKYPLPYMISVEKSLDIYTSSTSATTTKSTGKGSFTITEVANKRGKLKSGVGWVKLTGIPVIFINSATNTITPGEKVLNAAKQIGDYMVKTKYHYGKIGSEGSPTSFKQSINKKWYNASCTRYCSWVFQTAGFLKEGKCISHTLGNKAYLIDCQIIKVNKPFQTLLKNKTLKAGDMMVSSSTTCGGNYCSIFTGYNNGNKYWYEAGGPFKGTNTAKTSPYTYTNVGPLYVSYDYTHTVEYIIRPNGAGNGGIDISSLIK